MLARLAADGLPLGAQHAHEAFCRDPGALLQVLKPERGVHVIAQHRLAGGKIAVDDALDRLAEQGPRRNFKSACARARTVSLKSRVM